MVLCSDNTMKMPMRKGSQIKIENENGGDGDGDVCATER